MVKKHEEHSVWYACEKCHATFDTYEEAEKCEQRKPTKQLLRGETFREDIDWQIGDFLLIDKENKYPQLARISGTTEINHKIWPQFEFLAYGGEVYNYDTWHTRWVRVVTDKIRDVILEWAEALR